MISTSDILSITWGLVGLVGVIIAAATFWITRRNGSSIVPSVEPDVELGHLLQPVFPISQSTTLMDTNASTHSIPAQRHQDPVHRIIADIRAIVGASGQLGLGPGAVASHL